MVIISTNKGQIEGIKSAGCLSFLGIPYAKPPIGDLRFCEPQPMDAWDHIIKTVEYGPAAWQNHEELSPVQQEQNEDCLYLNIWTPAIDDHKRPVMFYIHGGGFLIGAGSRPRLNGERLVIRGNVVVVTFNYRLGALGFLDLPNIPSNIGIRDQITALKWVRDNIQNFGGDPNNITIFGESSGSESVVILLSIPSTRGMFHQAIMQSGVANPHSYRKELTRKGAKQLLSKLHIEENDIGALKEININRFIRAQKKIAGVITDDKQNPFRPFVDEEIIPEKPYELILKGNSNKVPLILGWNQEELSIIASVLDQADDSRREFIFRMIKAQILNHGISEKELDKLIKAYMPVMRQKYPNNDYKFWDAILSDAMFGIPTIRQLEAHTNHQSDVYCYIFTYGSTRYGGSFHSFECPFIFGNMDENNFPEGAIDSLDEARVVSNTMMDTWLNFAKRGNPNHKGLPEWPTYDIKKRATMMLGINSEVQYDPCRILRKAWDKIA